MFNKDLLHRHKIVEQLYLRRNLENIQSSNAYDKSLSIEELNIRTTIAKEELQNQLHYLTTRKIIKIYGRNHNVPEIKWFLLESQYYLENHFLKERRIKNFESYKRTFAYIAIPVALILAILTLIGKF